MSFFSPHNVTIQTLGNGLFPRLWSWYMMGLGERLFRMDRWRVRLTAALTHREEEHLEQCYAWDMDTCFLLVVESTDAILAGESPLVGEHQKSPLACAKVGTQSPSKFKYVFTNESVLFTVSCRPLRPESHGVIQSCGFQCQSNRLLWLEMKSVFERKWWL